MTNESKRQKKGPSQPLATSTTGSQGVQGTTNEPKEAAVEPKETAVDPKTPSATKLPSENTGQTSPGSTCWKLYHTEIFSAEAHRDKVIRRQASFLQRAYLKDQCFLDATTVATYVRKTLKWHCPSCDCRHEKHISWLVILRMVFGRLTDQEADGPADGNKHVSHLYHTSRCINLVDLILHSNLESFPINRSRGQCVRKWKEPAKGASLGRFAESCEKFVMYGSPAPIHVPMTLPVDRT